ncbi:MAG: 1-acyl-sn-glycerol-3-phosphate acyltransferase [Pseudomonadota bacterium]
MSVAEARGVVDQLIEERAPGYFATAMGRAFMRRGLSRLMYYDFAVELAATVRKLSARQIFELASRELAMDVRVDGLGHVPPSGPIIVTPNHPTGIADGVVLFDALKAIRPDVVFFANRDALRVAPSLEDMIIPVEWVSDRKSHARSRDTLVATHRAFQAGRCVVLFPAGRLAYWSWRGLRERTWQPTAINMARKYRAPIVPLSMQGRNSILFYALSQVSHELRDVTLFRELLNKKGATYDVRIGAPIDSHALEGSPQDIVSDLQHLVEHAMRRDGHVARLRPRQPRTRTAASLGA